MEINKPFYKEDKKIIYNLEQLELIVRSHKNENLILTGGHSLLVESCSKYHI